MGRYKLARLLLGLATVLACGFVLTPGAVAGQAGVGSVIQAAAEAVSQLLPAPTDPVPAVPALPPVPQPPSVPLPAPVPTPAPPPAPVVPGIADPDGGETQIAPAPSPPSSEPGSASPGEATPGAAPTSSSTGPATEQGDPSGSGGRGHGTSREGSRRAAAVTPPATQRRLERAVTRLHACLGQLPADERRVLGLRAGLGRAPTLSRTRVARRLGLGVARTGLLERRGLRRLGTLAGAGGCAGGGSASAALAAAALLGPPSSSPATRVAAGDPPADARPRFGIEGVAAAGGGDGDGGSGLGDALPPPLGHGGDATLPILLVLLAALGLLVRRELRRR